MLTLKQIQHFCAVLDTGTVQSAAQLVHVSQPALTRSIGNLEQELGLQLFERSKAGMQPTEFAGQIAPRFRGLLCELEDIRREALLYRNLEAGQLRVGLGQAIREPLVRQCLPQFVEANPGIVVKVQEGTPPELAKALEQREIDMIVAGVASYHEYDFGRAEHIMDIVISAVVRQGHPLANRESVAIKDLFGYPLAAPTFLSDRHAFHQALDIEQGQSISPHFMCSDYETLEAIVERTDAWTISLPAVAHRALPETLCELTLSGLEFNIELGVIELKQRSRSPAADRFVQTIRSILVA